jgi:peptidoglycan/xylan/chitin deacetylase (PgdA/CDA1 family)
VRIPLSVQAWAAARTLRRKISATSVILLYHRVIELPSDPYRLCVTPQHFAEHLQVVRRLGHPESLGDLSRRLRDGTLRRQSVVVTFDDGYADCLENANPLLDRYDVPATLFVTSGYVGSDREFWWDELERVFLQPGTLPTTLALNLRGTVYEWELGTASQYDLDEFSLHRHWNLSEPVDPGPRQGLFRSLYQTLHSLPEAERRKAITAVRTWAGSPACPRPAHRILSSSELVDLANDRLIEIGDHTATHPDLTGLPLTEQRSEIESSKTTLEDILGRPVSSFAYPHGARAKETVSIVKDVGFDHACSTIHDVVWRGSDRFQLPRFRVLDWDGETFTERLSEWLDC